MKVTNEEAQTNHRVLSVLSFFLLFPKVDEETTQKDLLMAGLSEAGKIKVKEIYQNLHRYFQENPMYGEENNGI